MTFLLNSASVKDYYITLERMNEGMTRVRIHLYGRLVWSNCYMTKEMGNRAFLRQVRRKKEEMGL